MSFFEGIYNMLPDFIKGKSKQKKVETKNKPVNQSLKKIKDQKKEKELKEMGENVKNSIIDILEKGGKPFQEVKNETKLQEKLSLLADFIKSIKDDYNTLEDEKYDYLNEASEYYEINKDSNDIPYAKEIHDQLNKLEKLVESAEEEKKKVIEDIEKKENDYIDQYNKIIKFTNEITETVTLISKDNDHDPALFKAKFNIMIQSIEDTIKPNIHEKIKEKLQTQLGTIKELDKQLNK